MSAAVIESPGLYERAVGAPAVCEVTLTAMRSRLVNAVYMDRGRGTRPSELLTSGRVWAVLDYLTLSPSPIQASVQWPVQRGGCGHGVVLWFDAVLSARGRLCSGPGEDVTYPQLFLPWTQPVQVDVDDLITVELFAVPGGDAWGWNTTILTSTGTCKLREKQSNFLSGQALPGPAATQSREDGR